MTDGERTDGERSTRHTEELLRLKRWADAERLARGLVAATPGDGHALCLLAQALSGQGRYAEALTAASHAATASPESLLVRIALVDALREAKVADALPEEARRLQAMAPMSAAAHYTAAHALAGDRWTLLEAQAAIDKAIELNPVDADAHNLRGVILDRRLWHPEAEEAFRTALSLDPASTFAQTNLAALLADTGRLSAATPTIRAALTIDPTHELPRGILAHTVRTLMVQLTAALMIAALVLTMVSVTGNYALRLVFGTAMLAGMVVYTVRVLRGAPPGLRRWLPDIWRSSDVRLGWPALLLLWTAVTSLLLTYLPPSALWAAFASAGLLLRAGVIFLVVLAVVWVRRRYARWRARR